MYLVTTKESRNVCVITGNDDVAIFNAWDKVDPMRAGSALIHVQGDKKMRLFVERLGMSLVKPENEEVREWYQARIDSILAEDVVGTLVKRYLRVEEIEFVE